MSASLVFLASKQNVTKFTLNNRFEVRAASTANVNLASEVENGDSFGGVTLATNDIVLIKDQVNAFDNGVYVVQAAGAPIRHASFDTAEELTYAHIFVAEGTNSYTTYFQTNVLVDLNSNQAWGTSEPVFTFEVPNGVTELTAYGCGGGGAGGSGGRGEDASNQSSGGGAGGGGARTTNPVTFPVTPKTILSIVVGRGGHKTERGTTIGEDGNDGEDGNNSTITGFVSGEMQTIIFPGASGGTRGLIRTAGMTVLPDDNRSPAAATYATDVQDAFPAFTSGYGGGVDNSVSENGQNAPTISSVLGGTITGALGGTGGQQVGGGFGGGGGGGGASSNFGPGGDGGNGNRNTTGGGTAGADALETNYGSGGGGGGGGSEAANLYGHDGGAAAHGFVVLYY